MLHVTAGVNAAVASSTVSSLDSGFVSQDASSLHTAYYDPGLLQLTNAAVSSSIFISKLVLHTKYLEWPLKVTQIIFHLAFIVVYY